MNSGGINGSIIAAERAINNLNALKLSLRQRESSENASIRSFKSQIDTAKQNEAAEKDSLARMESKKVTQEKELESLSNEVDLIDSQLLLHRQKLAQLEARQELLASNIARLASQLPPRPTLICSTNQPDTCVPCRQSYFNKLSNWSRNNAGSLGVLNSEQQKLNSLIAKKRQEEAKINQLEVKRERVRSFKNNKSSSIEKIKGQIGSAKRNCQQYKSEIEGKSQRLQDTQERLRSTQAEYKDTESKLRDKQAELNRLRSQKAASRATPDQAITPDTRFDNAALDSALDSYFQSSALGNHGLFAAAEPSRAPAGASAEYYWQQARYEFHDDRYRDASRSAYRGVREAAIDAVSNYIPGGNNLGLNNHAAERLETAAEFLHTDVSGLIDQDGMFDPQSDGQNLNDATNETGANALRLPWFSK